MIYRIPTTGYYQVSDWRRTDSFDNVCNLLSKLGIKSAPRNISQTVMYRRVGDTIEIVGSLNSVVKLR